jgi:hypothetical protein
VWESGGTQCSGPCPKNAQGTLSHAPSDIAMDIYKPFTKRRKAETVVLDELLANRKKWRGSLIGLLDYFHIARDLRAISK